MVMCVCRRVLGDWHEAEDAFQATFLVLARKAGSVGKPELLANWLYGVAFRTAQKAKGLMAQRRAKVKPLMEISIPPTRNDSGIAALGPVLDEELQRLPAKYRTPVVLCYFQGKTHEEIARQLGCPRETVSTRVARARERLRKRLVRRGVVLSSTALAAALSEQAVSASVTPALADATVKAAVLFAVAEGALAGTVSTPVIALTQGVIKAMLISKLVYAAIVVLALALIGTGTGLVWQRVAAGNAPEDSQSAANDNQKGQDLKAKEDKAAPREENILAQQRAKQWRQKLDLPVTIEFEPNTPLREALAHIAERYNMTILIDTQAFDAEFGGGEEGGVDIENAPIKLPRLNDVSLRTVLRLVLNQVRGDYHTSQNVLTVIPRTRLLRGQVSRQSIDVGFQNRPLSDVLKELSDITGVTVVLDARHQEKARLEISADLKNVPFLTALRVLADMADLKPVAMDNLIYVTSKENAKVLEAEEAKRKGMEPEKGIEPGIKKTEKATPKEKKPPVEKSAAPNP
jgi:RNA polymerase sigma factor (sigma-70 family)